MWRLFGSFSRCVQLRSHKLNGSEQRRKDEARLNALSLDGEHFELDFQSKQICSNWRHAIWEEIYDTISLLLPWLLAPDKIAGLDKPESTVSADLLWVQRLMTVLCVLLVLLLGGIVALCLDFLCRGQSDATKDE